MLIIPVGIVVTWQVVRSLRWRWPSCSLTDHIGETCQLVIDDSVGVMLILSADTSIPEWFYHSFDPFTPFAVALRTQNVDQVIFNVLALVQRSCENHHSIGP